jgi:hypothetical protein
MVRHRVAIGPDLLQSYVLGRSRAARKAKAEAGVAPTSRERPGARKAVPTNRKSRSLPASSVPPTHAKDAPGEELVAEDAWVTDDELAIGPVGAS